MADTGKLPTKIRVSLGTAIVIGLVSGKLDAAPTTAYLMTYRNGKCTANCAFCPQARDSSSRADMLSRVSWPVFPIKSVVKGLEKAVNNAKIKRICIQALNYPEVFAELLTLVKAIRRRANAPISLSCQPLNKENLRLLAEAGVERVGIALDAATEQLFDKVKGILAGGPYVWRKQFQLLNEAVNIFGKGRVSTHLIVGLGETEKEMVETIQQCVNMGVLPALFAFTPIAGTVLETVPQPPVERYRRVQMARHLIVKGITKYENMHFDVNGCIVDFGVSREKLRSIVESGKPFLTSGCPHCNRPYYNEKPTGPLYNYPRKLSRKEILIVKRELGLAQN